MKNEMLWFLTRKGRQMTMKGSGGGARETTCQEGVILFYNRLQTALLSNYSFRFNYYESTNNFRININAGHWSVNTAYF